MFATIYVPNFYLQAVLRHEDDGIWSARPIALIDERAAKPMILQLNPAAENAGVRTGMTPSQALARCMALLIKPRSLPQEKSAQDILLHQSFSLSPFVEEAGPGLCTVQFTDNRNLSEKVGLVVTQLSAFKITAQAGLGPTPDTSFLAANLARPVLQIENADEFLAPLPIEVLALGMA
jgi:nucleotidyltransferase/DNA polymerase involved in DNA repair